MEIIFLTLLEDDMWLLLSSPGIPRPSPTAPSSSIPGNVSGIGMILELAGVLKEVNQDG